MLPKSEVVRTLRILAAHWPSTEAFMLMNFRRSKSRSTKLLLQKHPTGTSRQAHWCQVIGDKVPYPSKIISGSIDLLLWPGVGCVNIHRETSFYGVFFY